MTGLLFSFYIRDIFVCIVLCDFGFVGKMLYGKGRVETRSEVGMFHCVLSRKNRDKYLTPLKDPNYTLENCNLV